MVHPGKNELHSNFIDKTFEDGDGLIWVLTGNGSTGQLFLHGVNYSLFNPYSEEVVEKKSALPQKIATLLEGALFYSVQTKDGSIVFITKSGQLIKYYHREKFEITPLDRSVETCYYFQELTSGQFWTIEEIKGEMTLRLHDAKGAVIKNIDLCVNNNPCPTTAFPYSDAIISQSANEEFYFSGIIDEQPAFVKVGLSGKMKSISCKSLVGDQAFDNEEFRPLFYDSRLDLYWILGRQRTVIVHPEKGVIKILDKLPLDRVSMKDNEHIVWAHHMVHGLYAIRIQVNPFEHYAKGQTTRGIITDDDQRLWIRIPNTPNFQEEEDEHGSYLINGVGGHSLLKDKEGTIWRTANIDNKFALLKYKKGDYKPKTIYPTEWEHFGKTIWAMAEDKETGLLWGGGGNGFLFQFNSKTEEIKAFDMPPYKNFKKLLIYQIYEDSKHHLWLCTSNGLFQMDKKKGIIAQYWKGGKGKFYLPAQAFHHLYVDEAGIFWIATGDGGLLKWDKNKASVNKDSSAAFQQFTIKDGLPSNVIQTVYEDDFKNLWLNTENGISQFNKTTFFSRNYLLTDGIIHPEGNRIAHYRDKQGKLYFGTVRGVNVFHPKDFQTPSSNEKKYLHIIGFEQFDADKGQLENHLEAFNNDHNIKLRPGESSVELTINKPFRVGGKSIFYNYQIVGFQSNPIRLHQQKIAISDMPFGDYSLELKAFDSSGKLLDEKSIPIFSLAPFYLQWWFLLGLVLVLGLLTFWIVRLRTNKLRAQTLELEKEVVQRTFQIVEDKKIIEQQNRQLLKLDEMKSHFFANVSHELRTPLTLIQGPIQRVLNSNELEKGNQVLLEKAQRNADKLLGFVSEILDFTKVEAGRMELNEKPISLYPLIQRVVGSFKVLAEQKDIQFNLQFQLPHNVLLLLDANKIEKILNNLLSNAFKFTPYNGQIDLIVGTINERLKIGVVDTGEGIPSKDLTKIFERYYQSQSQSQFGGTGIGLALCKEFVQLFGGKIWAKSRLGEGSSFYFTIPKKEVTSAVQQKTEIIFQKDIIDANSKLLQQKESIPQDNERSSILIVEDNYDLRDYLKILLKNKYKIYTAENGQEALDCLSNNEPALILSDVMMPVMDGFEFLEKAKAHPQWRNIPFIMLTARADIKDKLNALRIGVDDYIVKPFIEEELLVRIANLLTNYEARLDFVASEKDVAENIAIDEEKIIEKASVDTQVSEEDLIWLEQLESMVLEKMNHAQFSVDYLGTCLSINRNKLFKKTKSLTGLTPNQYVRAVRLQRAKTLFENQSFATITEVAQAVGFQNVGYFSNLFKKEYGKSPSDYHGKPAIDKMENRSE